LAQLLAELGDTETVGKLLLVNTTSSDDAVQLPLEIVHLKVAEVPTGTPVTLEVFEAVVTIVAVPLIRLQAPVPEVGLFPARVNEPLLQFA